MIIIFFHLIFPCANIIFALRPPPPSRRKLFLWSVPYATLKDVLIFNMRWLSEFGMPVLPALMILILCDDYSLVPKRFEFLGPGSALGEKDKRRKKKSTHNRYVV